jgi:BirA family biotin operon repressor/biotin-[acetyl-CoA-carboxylase] ligase
MTDYRMRMKKSFFVTTPDELLKNLPSDFIKKLHVFEQLDSTNSTAKELAVAGAEEGTVVIAKTQTHGRGRCDRTWQSPKGGVYLSLILRPTSPAEHTSLLSLLAALAVTTTLESYQVRATIKWPNDVRVKGKKIAGILLESEVKGNTVDFVIIGIGINLNINPTQLSADIRSSSTSLRAELHHLVDYPEFVRKFFEKCSSFYSLFKKNDFAGLVNRWKEKTDTIGKHVRIQTAQGTVSGTAVDINPAGYLLVKNDAGEIRTIMSGDCLYVDESHHT